MTASGFREIYLALLLFVREIPDSNERIALLKTIENYFFLRSIISYRFLQKHGSLKIAKEMILLAGLKTSSTEFAKKLHAEISNFKNSPGFADAVLEGFGGGYYAWNDLKYFMYEYELDLKKKARRKTDKIIWDEFIVDEEDEEDMSSIEHVFPQTPTDDYWKSRVKGLTARQVKKMTNSLGNLVPLSRPKNSSLKNISFDQKKGSSMKKNGYAYGSYSEIEISHASEWGVSEIAERGLRLLSFMEERWDISLGDRNHKLKCLGLDWVNSY